MGEGEDVFGGEERQGAEEEDGGYGEEDEDGAEDAWRERADFEAVLLGGCARAAVPGDGFREEEGAEEDEGGLDAAVVLGNGGIHLVQVFTYFPQGIAILTVLLLPRWRLCRGLE